MYLKPLNSPTFLRSLPWSPLCKLSENARFRCPCQIFHNSALRALLEPSFAEKVALCLHFKCIVITRSCDLRHVFLKPLKSPSFLRSFPWSPLCKISEHSRLRFPCQICHNSALRALSEPPFAAKCCPMFPHQLHPK